MLYKDEPYRKENILPCGISNIFLQVSDLQLSQYLPLVFPNIFHERLSKHKGMFHCQKYFITGNFCLKGLNFISQFLRMNIQIRTLSSPIFMTLALRFKFHCAEVVHSYLIFPFLSFFMRPPRKHKLP